jgi:hypothetical protein
VEHLTMWANRSYTKLSWFLYNKNMEQLQVLINRVYDNMQLETRLINSVNIS